MHFSFRQKVAFSLFTNVKCHDISRRFFIMAPIFLVLFHLFHCRSESLGQVPNSTRRSGSVHQVLTRFRLNKNLVDIRG